MTVTEALPVVRLHGEIDLLTAPAVERRLDALLAAGETRLLVDLRGVTFLDCAGLRPLWRAQRLLAERGGHRLGLVVTDPFLLRVMRLTGLLGTADMYDRPPAGVCGATGGRGEE